MKLKWLGVAVILIATLIVYQPALNIGFWTDDFWYVEMAGRLALPDYLRAYLDPATQWRWYRPMQGAQWWIEYALLRGEPVGYHLIQILLHAASASFLFLLVARLTRRLRVGLLAALLYLAISAYAVGVFQPSVVDPLLAPFYLLTIWFWLDYLEKKTVGRYVLTVAAFLLALATKEVAATLPLTLVLLELWIVRNNFSLGGFLRRYVLFFFILIPYAWIELGIASYSVFTRGLGYGPGWHMFSTFAYQVTLLAFPWMTPLDVNWILVLVVVALGIYCIVQREWRILFLVSAMVFTLAPVLPFPPGIARNPRYLYLPFMGSAILFALLIERARGVLTQVRVHWRFATPIAGALIALGLMWSGGTIADAADSFGGFARASRLAFRPIYEKYPSFSPGTLLYFLNPRYPNISGVMFLRYGKQVEVDGTDTDYIAGLRNHSAAYVFFLDDENRWRDQAASKNVAARAATNFPARFGNLVQAEGFELVSDQVKRGDALIVIVYWHGLEKIGKDYTVFAHLVDRDGKMVASVDRPPQEGIAPTSGWAPGARIPDGIVVPIPSDAPLGKDFHFEIGLYDPTTQVRLPLVGTEGQTIDDKIVIAPIEIVE